VISNTYGSVSGDIDHRCVQLGKRCVTRLVIGGVQREHRNRETEPLETQQLVENESLGQPRELLQDVSDSGGSTGRKLRHCHCRYDTVVPCLTDRAGYRTSPEPIEIISLPNGV